MEDELRRAVIAETAWTAHTKIPLAIGAACVAAIPFFPIAAIGAFIGLTTAAMTVLFRAGLCYDPIVQRATKRRRDQQRQDEFSELDRLDVKLRTDRDKRTQTLLRDLRQLYFGFLDDYENGGIDATVTQQMLDRMRSIFDRCVRSLDLSYGLLTDSQKMSKSLQSKALERRETILHEVEVGASNLLEVVSEIRTMGLKTGEGQISRLSERLEKDLEVAKRVDRIASLGVDDESDAEYHEFLANNLHEGKA